MLRRRLYWLRAAELPEVGVGDRGSPSRFEAGWHSGQLGFFPAATAVAAEAVSRVPLRAGCGLGAHITWARPHIHVHSGFARKFFGRRYILLPAGENGFYERYSADVYHGRHRSALGAEDSLLAARYTMTSPCARNSVRRPQACCCSL